MKNRTSKRVRRNGSAVAAAQQVQTQSRKSSGDAVPAGDVALVLQYPDGREFARVDLPRDIGRKVWETLDFALKARLMVVIDGCEGRGKSEAVKAWCRIHRGDARFVDLAGVTSKTTVFRAIAKARVDLPRDIFAQIETACRRLHITLAALMERAMRAKIKREIGKGGAR
jgi:hypothetical protein